jgi:hypothetical protein
MNLNKKKYSLRQIGVYPSRCFCTKAVQNSLLWFIPPFGAQGAWPHVDPNDAQ